GHSTNLREVMNETTREIRSLPFRPDDCKGSPMSKKLPDPVDKHVGSRIRMRRMMLGISQEKLAEALGLTFQQVQKYEKGINRICASRLHRIGVVLRVPVAFFFEEVPGQGPINGEDSAPSYVSDFLSTSEGLALTKVFVKLKDVNLRRTIVGLVEEIS